MATKTISSEELRVVVTEMLQEFFSGPQTEPLRWDLFLIRLSAHGIFAEWWEVVSLFGDLTNFSEVRITEVTPEGSNEVKQIVLVTSSLGPVFALKE